ncbi:CPBP family intramembrane glutamic endopeptidase [Microlunatus flavus]|uniref:Membrane protease YdiL, CAAX protease family n=1 Tax=Microlunatus flavus TaxID=1036181 RepID=A0A1H9DUM4_9ACTN|nr:CPBP family intramembrane glutamic endopeptidase [Microlunatus flavus]SEQ16438.1 Membrane protease YdiL, CAAX protease family [Microlunatus flavus]
MTYPVTYPPPVRALRDPMPVAPVAYPQMLRTPRSSWVRGLLMIVSFVAAYLLVSTVLQGAAIGWDVARGSVSLNDVLAMRLDLTPTLLLAVNLSNAAAIPLSMLLQRAFFGQRGRWLSSVTGRFRWRVLGRASLVALPFWLAYLAITLVAAPESVRAPSGTYLALLVIVVLTTPLQAAGEEFGARGLITRGAGSWCASPRLALLVGTLLSGAVFTLAHGAGDPWLIAFYFAFAVVLSLLTWRTGGLEVAVLLHTFNNLVAFGSLVLMQQDTSTVFDRGAGSAGPSVLLPGVILLLSAGALWAWASRTGLQRTYVPGPASAEPAWPGSGPGVPQSYPPDGPWAPGAGVPQAYPPLQANPPGGPWGPAGAPQAYPPAAPWGPAGAPQTPPSAAPWGPGAPQSYLPHPPGATNPGAQQAPATDGSRPSSPGAPQA